jgi:hypothetical protein
LPFEAVAQRFTFDRGHDIVEASVRLSGVEQREDVRMMQLCEDVDLAEEALRPQCSGQLGSKHLHRDVAMVLDVAREYTVAIAPLPSSRSMA